MGLGIQAPPQAHGSGKAALRTAPEQSLGVLSSCLRTSDVLTTLLLLPCLLGITEIYLLNSLPCEENKSISLVCNPILLELRVRRHYPAGFLVITDRQIHTHLTKQTASVGGPHLKPFGVMCMYKIAYIPYVLSSLGPKGAKENPLNTHTEQFFTPALPPK